MTESDLSPTLGCFTPRTFELLEGLHRNPNTDYYMGNRGAFEAHLMEPFRRLFLNVAHSLPSAITDVMETERWLFSRIPKNDSGQDGAWDSYWGAFYPEGSKRTADAQLRLWINYERLEFGFHIGDHAAEQRQRFLQRCRDNHEVLKRILADVLSSDDLVFGRHEDIVITADGTTESQLNLTWQDWLEHPDRADFGVSVVLPRDDALAYSESELIHHIAQTYKRLFPLVLLTTEDDPLPAIVDYLERCKPEDDSLMPLEVEGREFGIRALAYILDFIANIGITYVAGAFAGATVGIVLVIVSLFTGRRFSLSEQPGQWLNTIAGLILGLLYFTIFEWLHGATLGKLVFGMRVVKESGKPCGLKASFVRALYRIIDGFLFGAPAYLNMKPPLNQRIGDKKAETVVVTAKHPIIQQPRAWWWFIVALGLYLALDTLVLILVIAMAIR